MKYIFSFAFFLFSVYSARLNVDIGIDIWRNVLFLRFLSTPITITYNSLS